MKLPRAAMRARLSLGSRWLVVLGNGGRLCAEQQLKPLEVKSASRMKQPKSTHPMKASRWHVLQKSPEKLAGWKRHHLALPIRAALVFEGHCVVFAPDDGRVGDRRALHIAP